ncbi:retrovirus-related pol polyprotein from transposon TNT 1-94 [Tanacetum coccineum]
MYRITKTETQTLDSTSNINVSNFTSVESSNSVRRSKSKDNKSKDRVLKNTNDKRSSARVRKMSSSVSIDSNKRETMHSNVCQSNASVLNTKTVNAVNDGSNIVCVSCGKDVFLLSHKKYVARYALSIDSKVIQLVLWIVDSGCSKHMTGNLSLLRNFVEKFIGTVCFGNDHFVAITGYGDYVQGNLMICHVYYVEGFRHNLFSIRQFCDGDLEVAFRSNTCYVRNLEGDDLLTSSQESNLYTISISELEAYSSVFLMPKATSTKSLLWHQRLSHLNFGTINQLTSKDLVDGLPKFKYDKDHLCSACEQGKSKKASFPSQLVPHTKSKLELIHMDLCGPMRVESINGKKYILAQILKIRTDNGTEFKNEKLRLFYAKLGIIHHMSIARTPQQNGVVERRNCTLVEAARKMLIFSKTPESLWSKAIVTVCFTQNRSIIHTRKMKPKSDIGIFIGYSESSRGFHIYNHQTKKIMETIHVKFNELTAMASECNNLEPGFNCLNFQDSLEDSQSVPLKTDLDNSFGPLYEEYYATSPPEM